MYKTDASPLTLVYSQHCRGSKDLLKEQKCFCFPLVTNKGYIILGECGFVMPVLKAHNSKPLSCFFGQRSPFINSLLFQREIRISFKKTHAFIIARWQTWITAVALQWHVLFLPHEDHDRQRWLHPLGRKLSFSCWYLLLALAFE